MQPRTLGPTPRTDGRRKKERVSYDETAAHALLDEALVCHVGFLAPGPQGDQVFVIPTTYARVDDVLYVHGAAASRMLRALGGGVDVCVTVTLLDGIVLARSAFHHSMNYRSVVLFGRARDVTDPQEKRIALDAIVEHAMPGRSRVARPANARELAATRVLALRIDEASVKVRRGGPIDDPEDMALDVWAGEIPVRLERKEPVPHRPGTPL
jgi:nitroimidazol reductase NimA-like FMN-containing flavoprotein (pyridoxamine 5'-phosphate oxidase superfamily)